MKNKNFQSGFIALMATIIISLILLVMAVEEGAAGFHARFNILGTEAKEQATSLAEGCADQALAALVTDPLYFGNSTTTNSIGTCHVFPIDTSVHGLVTIKTQAEVRGSFANLEISMNTGDIHLGSIPLAPAKGTVVIIAHVVNDGSGTKIASDFTMSMAATNPSQASFPGSESGAAITVDPGAYTAGGTALAGYAQSVSTNCSGTIAAGELKFCTVVFDDITTTITVVANVVNNNSGTKLPSDVPLFIDGTPVTLGTRNPMSAGNHTVSASAMSGYATSTWGYQCNTNGTINVALGQNKTCVINYDDTPPPAPSCADTVMVLDRTGSMSSGDHTNEGIAGKSLVDLYSSVLPPTPLPQMGVGSIGGLDGSAASVPTTGWLSTAYNTLKNTITTMMNTTSSVGSDLAAGITVASNELNSIRHIAGKQKVIVLVSDGDPNQPTGSTPGSVTLAPSIVGTYDTWSTNTGGKVPAVSGNDGDGTYISPTVQAETYLLGNASVPAGAVINSVTLHAVAKETSGTTGNIILMAENGANTSADGGHSLSSSYTDYTWAMSTDPLSGTNWTVSEVNNWTTKFGVLNNSTGGTIPRVTQIYAVVAYTISSSGNILKSPTTAVSSAPNNQWTSAANAFTSNNVYATDAVNGHNQGYSNFGFSVPAGATITGIEVTTEAKISASVPASTPTLLPIAQGFYTAWTNGEATINEPDPVSCSGNDYILSTANNQRESAVIDLSGVPDGSIITSVAVTPYDRGDASSGGTYKTFVRINGTDTDASSNLTASNPSGCNIKPAQIIGVSATKNSATALEIGVVKVTGNNNAVRVGALRAVVNYTPPQAGSLGIALSSNNGTTWTGAKNVAIDGTETVDSPAGNSPADLWGRTWTSTDFNNGNFVLRVQNNSLYGGTVSLDQVTVNVYYTTSSSFTSGNLTPGTVGNYTAWSPNTGTAISTVLTNDSDTSYISNAGGSSSSQSFLFPNAAIPATATGISVTLHAFAKETNGSTGNIQLIAEKGGAPAMDAGHSLTSSYIDYSWTMNTNPTGGAWTVAEVNAWTTKFGVLNNSTGGTIPRVTQLSLVVNYTQVSDPIQAALNAADAAKLSGTDIFTIHFGSDPGPYQGKKLLANLASGASAVAGHQNGSLSDGAGGGAVDTGFIQPTSAISPNQWTNPTRAFVSDNSYATDAVNGHQQGFTNFGFAIPPTATINGVAVEVEAKSSDANGCQVGAEVSSNNGTSFTTFGSVAGVTGSDVLYTLGGAASLWGRTFVPSDFSNGNFVVRLQDIDPGSACTNGSTLSVDRVRARIYYTVANTENSDGDNFFVAPTSADMQGIFNFIGNQVCPAAGGAGTPPAPTTASILVLTSVINNNSGTSLASDFPVSVSAVNPSVAAFPGNTSGITVTVDPGDYNITEGTVSGYAEISGASCSSSVSGPIVAGETRVCVFTNDDIPPPPPPPNFNVNTGSWTEVPTAG